MSYNVTANNSVNATNLHQNNTGSERAARPLWYWMMLIFISLIAIFGNGLVIYVLATKRRLLTSANWFVMSLSLADFLIGSCLPPISAICNFYTCEQMIFYMFYNTLMSIAVISIFAMTFDRFLGIVFPLRYIHWMTSRRVAMIISAAWVVPVILSFLPITWSRLSPKESANPKRIHTSVMLIIFEFLPPVLMLLMYTKILLTARRHARQTEAQINQLKYNQYANTCTRNRTERSVRVIGAVILIFVGCWLLDIYKSICWHFHVCVMDRQIVYVSVILLFVNSAVNPIVYALLKHDFKRELKKLFCCRTLTSIQSTFEMTENKMDRHLPRNSVKSVYEMTEHRTNKTDATKSEPNS